MFLLAYTKFKSNAKFTRSADSGNVALFSAAKNVIYIAAQ